MNVLRERKPIDNFPRYFEIKGEQYEVRDKEHYDYLNRFAGQLYHLILKYKARYGFDYYSSSHPQEFNCFAVAMIMDVWTKESGTE